MVHRARSDLEKLFLARTRVGRASGLFDRGPSSEHFPKVSGEVLGHHTYIVYRFE